MGWVNRIIVDASPKGLIGWLGEIYGKNGMRERFGKDDWLEYFARISGRGLGRKDGQGFTGMVYQTSNIFSNVVFEAVF